MVRKPSAASREIGLGINGVHASPRPKSRPRRSQSVRSSDETSNDRGAKGTQEGGKMKVRNMDDKPTQVPARASRWWRQPSAIGLVGTRRLNDIFGNRGRHASPPQRRPH